jgi:uncharacterized UBP type Zn finger protein
MSAPNTATSTHDEPHRCRHVDAIHPVEPYSTGCQECQALGVGWLTLVLCLSCGWVACSDDSPLRHAWAHYEETDHPVAVSLQVGAARRWCYVHERRV